MYVRYTGFTASILRAVLVVFLKRARFASKIGLFGRLAHNVGNSTARAVRVEIWGVFVRFSNIIP